MNTTNCRSCDAPCIWTVTEKGSKMLVDVDPSEDGKGFVLIEQSDGSILSVWHAKAAEHGAEGQDIHQAHFATCPSADKHRRTAGRVWVGVLVFGLWSMGVLGLGMKFGGDIVRGETAHLSSVTQREVDSAWGSLLICSYEVVMHKRALDSALVWLSIPGGDAPPVVRLTP